MISGVDSLMPLTHLAHPPSHTYSSNPLFVLHIYESLMFCPPPCFYIIFASLPYVHVFCMFKSSCEWSPMIFVFLWLISLSIIPSSSIHVVVNDKISFFFDCWVILHCIYIYVCLLYPFIHRWTCGLFPYFGYCWLCCHKHGTCVPSKQHTCIPWIFI